MFAQTKTITMKRNILILSALSLCFIVLIIAIVFLAGCDNNQSINSKSSDRVVVTKKAVISIPEGQYMQVEDAKQVPQGKGKFWKKLGSVIKEVAENEMFLNETIVIREGKIISGTFNGQKEVEYKSSSTDSVFFADIPYVNDTKTIQLRLLAGDKLKFFIEEEELVYQMRR